MVEFTTMDFSGVEDPHNPGMDFKTAWAIQNEVGDMLEHHPRCSSVPGWCSISGPGFLCDCGAILKEFKRRRDLPAEEQAERELAEDRVDFERGQR